MNLCQKFRHVNKLNFAANVSGTSELRWRGSIDSGQVSFALDAAPPTRLQPGQTPLTASTHGNYNLRSGSLAISDLAGNTPATQILASGEVSSSSYHRLPFAT